MKLRMVIPIEIAVIGLLGAIYYGYHAVKGPEPEAKPDPASRTASATPSPVPHVETTRLVSKKGGFAVGVPDNVTAKKVGPTVTMTTADKVLSVLVAPVESGRISVGSNTFMRSMKKAYTNVKVTSTEAPKVDGHKARATYGRPRTTRRWRSRFVNVVVKAEPQELRDQRVHRGQLRSAVRPAEGERDHQHLRGRQVAVADTESRTAFAAVASTLVGLHMLAVTLAAVPTNPVSDAFDAQLGT